ncbi:MAG: site-specific integrase [Methylococcales bacterium]|nr:site-specific integrase [Methylococcales bacterium]
MLLICVVLALATGMRQGELMTLKWCYVDLKNGVAILHETKNGEKRRIAITGYALELLRDYAKVRRIDTPLLFPSPTKPQQPIELKKSFLRALSVAQIDNFHWHDLRHSAASYLAMNGASATEIAAFTGHKSLAMVARYTQYC